MAKRRKTRRQKISHDLRQTDEVRQSGQTQAVPSSTQTYTYTPQKLSIQTPVSTANAQLLKHDLLRTVSVTVAIVLAQIVLYFLLQI